MLSFVPNPRLFIFYYYYLLLHLFSILGDLGDNAHGGRGKVKPYQGISSYLKIWRKSEQKGLPSAIKSIAHFKWFRC